MTLIKEMMDWIDNRKEWSNIIGVNVLKDKIKELAKKDLEEFCLVIRSYKKLGEMVEKDLEEVVKDG